MTARYLVRYSVYSDYTNRQLIKKPRVNTLGFLIIFFSYQFTEAGLRTYYPDKHLILGAIPHVYLCMTIQNLVHIKLQITFAKYHCALGELKKFRVILYNLFLIGLHLSTIREANA